MGRIILTTGVPEAELTFGFMGAGDVVDLPYPAMAALAQRFANPRADSDALMISTLLFFQNDARRPLKASDHTPESRELAKRIVKEEFHPTTIGLNSLSRFYETCLTQSISSMPKLWGHKGGEYASLLASNAVSQVVWDLARHSDVICGVWLIDNKPYVPNGVRHAALFDQNDIHDPDDR